MDNQAAKVERWLDGGELYRDSEGLWVTSLWAQGAHEVSDIFFHYWKADPTLHWTKPRTME